MQRYLSMKYFKHLSSGMSLIEVMLALTIFAIFGSSLFMMQQYLFERMIFSQKKLISFLRMQEELVIYQNSIIKELCDYENGSVEKSLEEKNKNFYKPDMIIKTTTKSKLEGVGQDNKESLFKKFKNLHLVCVSAEDAEDTDSYSYGKLFTFTYIPELKKENN